MHRSRAKISARLAVAMMASLVLAAPASADDGATIAAKGAAEGSPACASCHGAHGEGAADSGFPRLAGLKAAYLREQLQAFADGTRESDIMTGIAKSLSPEARDAVASYYAGLATAIAPAAEAPDAKLIARGNALAVIGDWAHGVPGCGQCHGPAGQGVGDRFPPLAGQSAAYIEGQFAAWKEGKRKNDPLHLMAGIASKLSDDDVKAVAAYYAGLGASVKDGAHE